MNYDVILKHVGEFGKYQKIKYLLLCLCGLSAGLQAMISIFTLATPKHRCELPAHLYNGTDSYDNISSYHGEIVTRYIPRLEDGSLDSCHLIVLNGNDTSSVECKSWVFDKSEVSSSVVTKMGLVCSKTLMATLASSMYMFGNLVGSLITGIVSDIFGRRVSILMATAGQVVSGIVLSFTPEFYSYAVFRFFMGAFNIQLFITSFVLGVELIGPGHRITAGIGIEIFWAIGFFILIGLAYILRNEVYVQLAGTLPSLFFLSYYWLLPESPRWLMVKNRIKEAEDIIHAIAKVNKTQLPDGIELELEQERKPESAASLRKAPRLLCRTVIIFFNWFVITMAYYGLSLNSGNMPGSLYVNMAFSAFGEIMGYIVCFLCFIFGRKKPHVTGMLIGALACISSIAVFYLMKDDSDAKNWTLVVLTTIGKLGITTGFCIIYLWSGEIFPTVLRTSLMGCSSMMGRVGSIMAPVIADIGKLVPPAYSNVIPPLIFGVLNIVAGLLSIVLPETTGHDLPETIEEANIFPRKPQPKYTDADSDDEEFSMNAVKEK